MKDPDKGYILPAIVDAEWISVCVPVPNDEYHKRAFMGALYELSWRKNWQYDGTDKRYDTARVWGEIYDIVRERLGLEYCEPCEPPCREFASTTGFIEYGPNDPRYTPDLVPDGYASPPWYFATTASNLAYGSHPGDIITSFERLPIVLPPGGVFVPAGWPYFKVYLNGSGTVRVYLRSLTLGGLFIVTRSDNPLSFQFVDVNTDAAQAPPETHNEVIFEAEFETPGQHWLQFNMVPAIDLEEVPLAYGGGITKIELCGFGTQESGMDCCNEITVIKNTIVQQENRRREEQYDGTPASINPHTPENTFSNQSTSEGNDALCMAVQEFVKQLLFVQALNTCGGDIASSVLSLIANALVHGVPGAVAGGLALEEQIVGCINLIDAVGDPEAVQNAVCMIVQSLAGKEVTEASFNTAMTTLSDPDVNTNIILFEVRQIAQQQENYLWFLDLLGQANQAADAGRESNCDCVDDLCGEVIDFRTGLHGAYLHIGTQFETNGIRDTGGAGGFEQFQIAIPVPDGCTADPQITMLPMAIAGWNFRIWFQTDPTNPGEGPWINQSGIGGNWADATESTETITNTLGGDKIYYGIRLDSQHASGGAIYLRDVEF